MDTLVAIKMQNFQSWANGTIQFKEGLNVIKGENSGGKSAIFNALMMACNPNKFTAKERKDLIRFGQEYAQAVFIFSGYQAGIVRILKNKVIYLFSNDIRTKKYDTQIGVPHKELLELLEVYVEPRTGFLLNVIDSDRPLLLVNSDQKADSSLVSSLIQSPELRRLIDLFESKLPELESQKAKLLESQYRLEGRLTDLSYTDLNSVESEINSAELLMEVFPKLIRIYDYLNTVNIVDYNLAELDIALDFINLIEQIESTGITTLDTSTDNYDADLLNICNLALALEETNITNLEALANLNEINEQEELLNTIDVFMEIHNRLSIVEDIQNTTFKINSELQKAYELMHVLETLDSIYRTLNTTIQSSTIMNETLNNINQLEEILNNLANENEILKCPIHDTIVFKNGECIPVISKEC